METKHNKIASDLKASETKQRNLSKAYDSLKSQANDLLVFSIQWKDLQDHFDDTRHAMQIFLEDIRSREKVLEAKEDNFNAEMGAKRDELLGLEKLMDEKVKEVMVLNREAGIVEKRVKERTKKLSRVANEVAMKEKELGTLREEFQRVEKNVEDLSKEVKSREDNLRKLREDLKVKGEQLEELEGRVKSREENLRRVEKSLEDQSKMLGSKEEEVRVIQGSLSVCRESILSKEGELDAILESIEGKRKEVEVKEERIRTLQGMIDGCDKELKSRGESRAVKVKEYGMEEWSCKLELKERDVELKEKRLESMREDVKKWVEERSKELNSLSAELKAKETELQQEADDLELAKKTQQNNAAALLSSVNDESNMNFTDGRNLLLYMYEHMKRNESMSKRISSFLQQVSSEPGKLVLDAMQGFYPPDSSVENDEIDLVLVRRACLLLLDELKGASPQISPELREEAVKLATDWKTKMKVGSKNWMESLGFLCLVNTYGMSSAFDPKELQSLLVVVSHHAQGMGLSRGLGFTDKAPDYSKICVPVKTESRESLVAKNEAASSNVHETATTSDETDLKMIENEQSRGLIYHLINRKNLIGAAGLIYTLKLSDEFSFALLLKEFVDLVNKQCRTKTKKKKSLDEKDNITDLHIADLRAVLLCIRAYNLESAYSPEEIESQIAQLEKCKEQRQPSQQNVECKKRKRRKTPKAKHQQKAAQSSFNVEQQQEQNPSETKLLKEQKGSVKVESEREDEHQEHQKTSDANVAEIAQLEKCKEQTQTLQKNVEFQKQKPRKTPKAKHQQKAAQRSSNVEQQEQNPSKTKLHEEQKGSIKVESEREDEPQEHQKTSDATLQAKVEQTASDIVEEQQQLHQQEQTTVNSTQQEQNTSKAIQQEQPKQKKGKKRFTRFDQQHPPQNKCQKTSIVPDRPSRSQPFHPNYPLSSSSAWPHQLYGHHMLHPIIPVQVGNVVNHAANYGYGGHNPVLNHAYPYFPRPPM